MLLPRAFATSSSSVHVFNRYGSVISLFKSATGDLSEFFQCPICYRCWGRSWCDSLLATEWHADFRPILFTISRHCSSVLGIRRETLQVGALDDGAWLTSVYCRQDAWWRRQCILLTTLTRRKSWSGIICTWPNLTAKSKSPTIDWQICRSCKLVQHIFSVLFVYLTPQKHGFVRRNHGDISKKTEYFRLILIPMK